MNTFPKISKKIDYFYVFFLASGLIGLVVNFSKFSEAYGRYYYTISEGVGEQKSEVVQNECVVKGNIGEDGRRKYFVKSDMVYKNTKPEACFDSIDDALMFGFEPGIK